MSFTVESLRQHHRPGARCYLLLDGAVEPKLLSLIFDQQTEPQVFPLYAHTPFANLQGISPLLVAVDIDDGLFAEYVNKGIAKHWGLLLSSDHSFEQLVQHAQWWLTMNHPDGGEMLFRGYDPRIAWRLLAASTPEQHAYWLGPFASVECMITDGTFEKLPKIEPYDTLLVTEDRWLRVINVQPTHDVHRYGQIQTFTANQITAMEEAPKVKAREQLYNYIHQYHPHLLRHEALVPAIYQFMGQFSRRTQALVPDDHVVINQRYPVIHAFDALTQGIQCQTRNEQYLLVDIIGLLGEQVFFSQQYDAVYQLITQPAPHPLSERLAQAYELAKQYGSK